MDQYRDQEEVHSKTDETDEEKMVNQDPSPTITSLDATKSNQGRLLLWAKENPQLTALCAALCVAVITLGGIGIHQWVQSNGQVDTDVVPARHGLEGSQSVLGNAKVVGSYGNGSIATIDHQQGGKEVSAKIVEIDAVGNQDGATLVPPENLGQVGWFNRSAEPGSTKGDGTTVMTSHVNYNGLTGYGAVFLTLKKGDPISVTDKEGKVINYTVTKPPYQINKRDPEYVKKTMNTINRSKGKNSLILITCGGNYVGGSLGYDENFIVEAHIAGE